jgi:NAD(P)-dependent dehydrogenase (short-subunit alcohol dehydrogenase family)
MSRKDESQMTTTAAAPIEVPNPVGSRFENGVAVVAGGGRTDNGVAIGVGAATAILLASEGCRIGVVDINVEAAQRTVETITAAGGEAMAVQADVTSEADCARAMSAIRDAYGPLDALLNTLGVPGGKRGVQEFVEEEWERLINVNLKGFILTSRHAIPRMTHGGAIVNVSSADAEYPCRGSAAFSASKGGVNALTRHIAVREGHLGIRANAVMPGPIWTPVALSKIGTKIGLDRQALQEADKASVRERRRLLTATQTEGTAWDIAHTVAFLASKQARWITGQVVLVDGGATRIAPWDHDTMPVRDLPDPTAAFIA